MQLFASIWTKKILEIAGSSSLVLDSLPQSKVNRVEYVLSLKEAGGSLVKAFKLVATVNNGAVSDQVFGLAGGVINTAIESKLNAGNIELELTNNELFDLEVTLARLSI